MFQYHFHNPPSLNDILLVANSIRIPMAIAMGPNGDNSHEDYKTIDEVPEHVYAVAKWAIAFLVCTPPNFVPAGKQVDVILSVL